MKLQLSALRVSDWKGIKNESFRFNSHENFIYGANGSGKSSMFAAFIWLLFGKDQFGRQDHQIKPLDASGDAIHRLNSEIEAVLLVDGKELTLKRVYREKWIKPKTEVEEVFDGNTTDYYINDVPVSKKDYDAKVTEICNETVFKSITSPHYFTSLGWKEQRDTLFGMVDAITDEQIASGNEAFLSILKQVEGVGFERFSKELSAKKSRIKKEIEGIDPRIDEHRRNRPALMNFSAMQKELVLAEKDLESIEASISDVAKKSESENAKRMAIQAEINKLERDNQQIGFDAEKDKGKQIEAIRTRIRAITLEIGDIQRGDKTKKARLEFLIPEAKRLSTKKEELINEYKAIKARELVFHDGAFDCPTCHRPLEVSDIESKQSEMSMAFNASKAEEIAVNVSKGRSIASQIKLIEDEIAEIGEVSIADVSELEKEIGVLNQALASLQSVPVDFSSNELYLLNLSKIKELKDSLSGATECRTDESLIEHRNEIKSVVKDLSEKLSTKLAIEKTDARIEELNKQHAVLNQELADLEQTEYIIKEFEFAKNKEYEARINSMFHLVQFRLFKQQVDGQIIPTCECMVNGTPYSTQNNAMQIAMGLDIINAISSKTNAFAPIWIDNREGVTEIPKMNTQIINLVVDPEQKVLTIK